MSSTQAKGWLLASLFALLLSACSSVTDQPHLTTTATPPLYVSLKADRSGALSLSNMQLSGQAYIFARASGVRRAAFYLDDPRRSGRPVRVERSAPFDLASGTAAAANPFDTRTLRDGAHTLTVALSFSSGYTRIIHTPFTVKNTASVPPTTEPTPAPTTPTGFAEEILTLVNDARRSGYTCGSRGVFAATTALTLEPRLTNAAQGHADDMQTQGYFSHTGKDGSTVGTRVTRAGYSWSRVGENIAYGYPDADAVMAGWLKSDGHCANLMNPNYTHLGVGKGGSYWVQVFARPQ